VLLNLGTPGSAGVMAWAERVEQVDAAYAGAWVLPAVGTVSAPAAVLIRPDGHVAWVGDGTETGLSEALTTWFGPAETADPAQVDREVCRSAGSRPSRHPSTS
jgi:hypothetical protein